MSQQKHVLDLFKELGMLGCKPIDTPIEPNHKLSKASDDTYRVLQYLESTLRKGILFKKGSKLSLETCIDVVD